MPSSKVTRNLIKFHSNKLTTSTSGLEDVALFLVDINYIAYIDKGINDPECRKMIIDFLQQKDHWINITDLLYRMYPEEQKSNHSNRAAYEIIIADPAFKHDLNRYHFSLSQGECLDLFEKVTLQRNEFVDRDFFNYFFTYRLSKIELDKVKDFLTFSLHNHFENDVKEFSYHLKFVIIPKYSYLLDDDKIKILSTLLSSVPVSDNTKPTQLHIALAITYRQLAGTLLEWEERTRTAEITKIALGFDVSPDKLLKFYRKVHDGKGTERLDCIKKQKDQEGVAELLFGDEKAILALKRDIDKL